MTGEFRSWPSRPQPASDILNPAISAVCVAWCASRYESEIGAKLPLPLAFLVAPLTMHAPTRARFPRSTTTHFSRWVTENAEVLAGYPDRARSFVPYVREGLRLAIRTGLLTLYSAGLTAEIAPHSKIAKDTELRSIATSSALCGSWFARAGSIENTFTQLGVRP
ncbi:three component ABC system middle component [Microbacterium aerolatum]|uniref:three component ABC system middle component n=1 Tax=Microbacterium aerolatum TaxID=153731 RepID=UPI003557A266